MAQRLLMIAVFLALFILSVALLITEASGKSPHAASETDYLSLDAPLAQPTLAIGIPTPNSTHDIRILSFIAIEQMEDIENQAMPPSDLELDYGDAAFNLPN